MEEASFREQSKVFPRLHTGFWDCILGLTLVAVRSSMSALTGGWQIPNLVLGPLLSGSADLTNMFMAQAKSITRLGLIARPSHNTAMCPPPSRASLIICITTPLRSRHPGTPPWDPPFLQRGVNVLVL